MNARPASSGRPWFNLLAAFVLPLAVAVAPTSSTAASDESKTASNLTRLNGGAQIEWTAPDGQTTAVTVSSSDTPHDGMAYIMDDETVSCPLPEGQTTFVIKVPTTAVLDHLAFANENATAAGKLKISVANEHLPAASTNWVEVDGSIAFTGKRLVTLSLVGVDARYVRLTFQVEKAGHIASLGLYGGETLERFALR